MAFSLFPAVWPMSTAAIYTLVTINILTAITSILINYCFIAGILSKKELITPTNLFVVTLAVSDLLVGLISQPMLCAHLLVNRMTVRSYAIAFCSFYSLGVFCGASGNCLPVISLDRYIRIKKLQHYTKYVTIKRVVIVIVAVWINAVVTAFLPLYGVSKFAFYIIIIIGISIIAIVMSFAYFSMIRHLAKAQLKVRPIIQQAPTSTHMNTVVTTNFVTARGPTSTPTATSATLMDYPASTCERRRAKDISRQLRITITVAILVAVVIVSWLPCFFSGLIRSLNVPVFDKDSKKVTMHYVTVTIGFVSSSVNPLLYCWRIKNVRKAALDMFRKTVTFKVCCRNSNEITSL
eukprot:Seg3505.2 transcript_id=Seg3505.2/GoldUCD/mRNA.D3Y31 product="Beta-1 adrenergic receptor" protein_id=Seg3505.2/GoldUCD/D3Y31